MAALSGMGICNALIEIDGPEVPILDGSALPFVREIRRVGCLEQAVCRPTIVVRKSIEVRSGLAWARFEPHDGFCLEGAIEFADTPIGRQSFRFEGGAQDFERELASSRTFCFARDITRMHTRGQALGGSWRMLWFMGITASSPRVGYVLRGSRSVTRFSTRSEILP